MAVTMPARACKTYLSDGTDIPDRNAVDASPEDGVFRTVDSVSALAKVRSIALYPYTDPVSHRSTNKGKVNSDDSIHAFERRLKARETLKGAIQNGDAGDPNTIGRAVMEDSERYVSFPFYLSS